MGEVPAVRRPTPQAPQGQLGRQRPQRRPYVGEGSRHQPQHQVHEAVGEEYAQRLGIKHFRYALQRHQEGVVGPTEEGIQHHEHQYDAAPAVDRGEYDHRVDVVQQPDQREGQRNQHHVGQLDQPQAIIVAQVDGPLGLPGQGMVAPVAPAQAVLPPPLSLHRLTTFATIILCARIGADVYRKIQYNFIHPPVECQRIYH